MGSVCLYFCRTCSSETTTETVDFQVQIWKRIPIDQPVFHGMSLVSFDHCSIDVNQVVMNHMANEFYFEGHEETTAPWRFHENRGEREYLRLGKHSF